MGQTFRDGPLLEMAKGDLKMVQLWSQAQVNSSYLLPSNVRALFHQQELLVQCWSLQK